MTENDQTAVPVVYRIETRFSPGSDPDRVPFLIRPQLGDRACNVALLRSALEWLTEHPEVHNQGTWFEWRATGSGYTSQPEILDRVKARVAAEPVARPLVDTACGTAGCLFGWAVVIDGRFAKLDLASAGTFADRDYATIRCQHPSGLGGDWESTGRYVLQLTQANATAISYGDNSIGDLWRIASIITAGEIAVPEQFAAYDGTAEAEAAELTEEECSNAWEDGED